MAQRLTIIACGLESLPSEQNTRYDVLDVNDCLDDAVAAVTRAAPVEVDRQSEAAPTVFASRAEVVMLLANVIENAARASRDKGAGRIVVRTDEERGKAVVVVMDDGGCLPAVMVERLLEPFNGSRQGRLSVGLAIAARLAERNGGSISIVAADEGMAARIVLPPAT